MRVFIVNGASRNNGYTQEMLALFYAGATESGAELDVVELRGLEIHPCLGCFGCLSSEGPARCVQNDDMGLLLERYQAADVVVFATPLYFYSISARLKTFIERLLPLTQPTLSRGPALGLFQNALREPDRGPKTSVLIAVGAHRDLRGMDGVVSSFNLISDALNLSPVGKILRTESFFLDFPAHNPKTMQRIRAAFKKAGRELASEGALRPDTEADAALSLTDSPETYEHQCSVYWEHARQAEGRGIDRSSLKQAVNTDLRILMPELAGYFDSAAAGDLEAVFLFEITGYQPGTWQIVVSEGTCQIIAAPHEQPDVTICAPSEVFLDVVLGRIDPRRALAKGQLEIRGNIPLFARFGRLFLLPE